MTDMQNILILSQSFRQISRRLNTPPQDGGQMDTDLDLKNL